MCHFVLYNMFLRKHGAIGQLKEPIGKRTVQEPTGFYVRKATKSIYILRIYIVKGTKMTKNRVYHMGILWVWYGYPMVREAEG